MNTLRMKITGVCNQACSFCHEEGGMSMLDELSFIPELEHLIESVYFDFNTKSIALSGGEPLLHNKLEELLFQIHFNTPIKNFSITTNGTIKKNIDFWKSLACYGLVKANVSISSFTKSNQIESNAFDTQLHTIRCMNCIGIEPSVNIVVCDSPFDTINLLTLLCAQKHLKFSISLLPNLNDRCAFERSMAIIRSVLGELNNSTIIDIKHKPGTSDAAYNFSPIQEHALWVKTTKINGVPTFLPIICNSCSMRDHCQEGFYGLRVESQNNQLLVRLCLYRSDSTVLLSVHDFVQSPVYGFLKSMWNK